MEVVISKKRANITRGSAKPGFAVVEQRMNR